MAGSTTNKNSTINTKRRTVYSEGDESELDDFSDDELPLSSIFVCLNNSREVKYEKKCFVSSNTKTSRSTINNNCTFNSKQRTIDSEDDISELDDLSDNELPLSSITDNLSNCKQVKYKNICGKPKYCLNSNADSIENINNTINMKLRTVDCEDISEIDDVSDNELPLSSIADFLNPIDSHNPEYKKVRHKKRNGEKLKLKFDEQIFEEYKCNYCEQVFHKRIAIITHLRRSICFPDY